MNREASCAKNQPVLHRNFLLVVRVVVALIWLYEGLWQKVLVQDSYELSIVQQFAATPDQARRLMLMIGASETFLALGVLSGLYQRALAWFQIVLLVGMNLTGIIFGNGAIANPIGLLIHNLPLIMCIALIGIYAPGTSDKTSR